MTRDDIKHLFDWCPESGVLRWKSPTSNRVKAGDVAGNLDSKGYYRVGLHGAQYRLHRVIWLLAYGEWPKGEIDHIDGNRINNSISNLRCVSHKRNSRNCKLSKNNTSGHIGITWHKKAGKWMASVSIDGRQQHLGLFDDKRDAISARAKASETHGFHANHGRSAPL